MARCRPLPLLLRGCCGVVAFFVPEKTSHDGRSAACTRRKARPCGPHGSRYVGRARLWFRRDKAASISIAVSSEACAVVDPALQTCGCMMVRLLARTSGSLPTGLSSMLRRAETFTALAQGMRHSLAGASSNAMLQRELRVAADFNSAFAVDVSLPVCPFRRDATVGLATMEIEPAKWTKKAVAELSSAELDTLSNWVGRFRQKYDVVGFLNDGARPMTLAEARSRGYA